MASSTLQLPPVVMDKLQPDFHQVNLDIETFIKNDLQLKLDKDDQICRLSLTPQGCPLGPQACPLRHTTPSPLNFIPPPPLPNHPRDRERVHTVCKHWLRGLCKKSDSCEFLHEYNLRKMPACYWLAKYGYCPGGDECLYWHPPERKRVCEDYNRGFCFLGPRCPRQHIPSQLCLLYLTGFCPFGPTCAKGHPKETLPPLEAYRPPSPPTAEPQGPPPPGYGRYSEFDPARLPVGGYQRRWEDRSGGGGRGGFGGGQSTGGAAGGGRGPFMKDLASVTCFKCGETGHFANKCPNPMRPGQRGPNRQDQHGGGGGGY